MDIARSVFLLVVLYCIAPTAKSDSPEDDLTCEELLEATDLGPTKKFLQLICRTARMISEEVQPSEEPMRLEGSFLYIAYRNGIRAVNLTSDDGSFYGKIISNYRSIAIDYDPVAGYLYWTGDRSIHRIKTGNNVTGSAEKILTRLSSDVDGIAVDWVARNLYWSDATNDGISVSKLDGSSRKKILKGLHKPRAIALDPAEGKMYWTEWGDYPGIFAASLDGRNKKTLVNSGVKWPNGIAIDFERRRLFFADAHENRIEMIGLDGTGRSVLLADYVEHIFSLSYLDGYLYWSDWKSNEVERMLLNDTSTRESVVWYTQQPFGVKATRLQPPVVENACARNNGGCSDLCFYTPEGVRCGCGDEEKLGADRLTCESTVMDDPM